MAKTEELSGMEGEGIAVKKIAALDKAVETWRAYVEQRMSLTEKEVEARDKCIALMHKHNVVCYRYWISDEEQKLLVLDSTEKLKLKKADAADEPSKTDVEDD
jgi:hypothetical protein